MEPSLLPQFCNVNPTAWIHKENYAAVDDEVWENVTAHDLCELGLKEGTRTGLPCDGDSVLNSVACITEISDFCVASGDELGAMTDETSMSSADTCLQLHQHEPPFGSDGCAASGIVAPPNFVSTPFPFVRNACTHDVNVGCDCGRVPPDPYFCSERFEIQSPQGVKGGFSHSQRRKRARSDKTVNLGVYCDSVLSAAAPPTSTGSPVAADTARTAELELLDPFTRPSSPVLFTMESRPASVNPFSCEGGAFCGTQTELFRRSSSPSWLNPTGIDSDLDPFVTEAPSAAGIDETVDANVATTRVTVHKGLVTAVARFDKQKGAFQEVVVLTPSDGGNRRKRPLHDTAMDDDATTQSTQERVIEHTAGKQQTACLPRGLDCFKGDRELYDAVNTLYKNVTQASATPIPSWMLGEKKDSDTECEAFKELTLRTLRTIGRIVSPSGVFSKTLAEAGAIVATMVRGAEGIRRIQETDHLLFSCFGISRWTRTILDSLEAQHNRHAYASESTSISMLVTSWIHFWMNARGNCSRARLMLNLVDRLLKTLFPAGVKIERPDGRDQFVQLDHRGVHALLPIVKKLRAVFPGLSEVAYHDTAKAFFPILDNRFFGFGLERGIEEASDQFLIRVLWCLLEDIRLLLVYMLGANMYPNGLYLGHSTCLAVLSKILRYAEAIYTLPEGDETRVRRELDMTQRALRAMALFCSDEGILYRTSMVERSDAKTFVEDASPIPPHPYHVITRERVLREYAPTPCTQRTNVPSYNLYLETLCTWVMTWMGVLFHVTPKHELITFRGIALAAVDSVLNPEEVPDSIPHPFMPQVRLYGTDLESNDGIHMPAQHRRVRFASQEADGRKRVTKVRQEQEEFLGTDCV